MRILYLLLFGLLLNILGDGKVMSMQSVSSMQKVISTPFGKTKHGESVELFTLTNSKGTIAKIMTYGATLTELWTHDKNGKLIDIVLGFDNFKDYEQLVQRTYFGSTVGRYANRIGEAKFSLDGKEYKLSPNNGQNMLHGGAQGFDTRIWQAEILPNKDSASVKFSYLSKDMEEGFPGNFNCSVIYTLTDNNELKLEYEAKTDKPTVVNLTNHAYFNLSGAGNGTILDHLMQINADAYTEVNDQYIPTGKIINVTGNLFDLRQATRIEKNIEATKGYDVNYVLQSQDGKLAQAAIVYSPQTQIELEVLTTEPGLQFYPSVYLNGSIQGIGGVYPKYGAFCLEAQHYPDSPNHDNFPSTILRTGQIYTQTTVYKLKQK